MKRVVVDQLICQPNEQEWLIRDSRNERERPKLQLRLLYLLRWLVAIEVASAVTGSFEGSREGKEKAIEELALKEAMRLEDGLLDKGKAMTIDIAV